MSLHSESRTVEQRTNTGRASKYKSLIDDVICTNYNDNGESSANADNIAVDSSVAADGSGRAVAGGGPLLDAA